MVNNRRSEMEIIAEILSLSREGAKSTEILYRGYLSYTQLKKYLPFLIENQVLMEDYVKKGRSNCRVYRITDKGRDLLKDINKTLSYFE